MTRDILAERAEIDAATEGRTLCSEFERTAASYPDLDAFRWRTGDAAYDSFTWSEYRERVRNATLGLRALGLKPGDFALIQARCIPEHSVADMGIVHARATPVSLYNTLSPEQICYIADHCGARIAIVEDVAFLEHFLKVRDELPLIERVVLINGADEAASDWVVSWDEVLAFGAAEAERDPGAFDESWKQVTPDDLATLIYTSGTTGPPKAVMDTHRNIIWHFEMTRRVYEFRPDDHGLSYLPLAHAAGRTGAHWNPLLFGGTVICCPDINQLLLVPHREPPDALRRSAARVREALRGDARSPRRAARRESQEDGDRRARRRPRDGGARAERRGGSGGASRALRRRRSDPPGGSRARRPRPVARCARRRRADLDRGHRVLPRARHPRLRGVGDERADGGRHRQRGEADQDRDRRPGGTRRRSRPRGGWRDLGPRRESDEGVLQGSREDGRGDRR